MNPSSQEKSRSSLRGPGARPRGALSLNGAGAGPKLTPLYVVIVNCEGSGMRRCHNCGQELIKINNQGERLAGCLTCNLWAPAEGNRWIRLSEEDLRALHQLRHSGKK